MMALTPINLGSAPNDGRGDNLRTAGQKINANFGAVEAVLGTIPTGIEGAGARSFTNVAALLATNQITYSSGSNRVVAGNIIRTLAEGHIYEVQASTVSSANGVTHLNVNGVGLILRRGRLTANCEVRVPTHFPTGQAAVDYYAQLTACDKRFTLRFNTGHQPTSGMVFKGHDFSHFRITAESSAGAPNPGPNETSAGDVFVNSSFSGDFILVDGCPGPTLSCVINQNNRGANGIRVEPHGSVTVDPGAGVIYARANGLTASTASVIARGAIFRHAGISGFRFSMASQAEIRAADASYAGHLGNTSSDAGICIFVSRQSCVHADLSGLGVTKANYGSRWGLRVHRAYFSGRQMEAMHNASRGAKIAYAATVNLYEANLSHNAIGVDVDASFVSLEDAVIEHCSDRSIACNAGVVDARGAKCRRDGRSDSLDDMRVYNGGEIKAHGAQGGSRAGINVRTDNGIIWGNASQTTNNVSGTKL